VLQVADQAMGLVLGSHRNAAHARVEGVRQRKVDDPHLAAEEHRRLGPFFSQILEPAAATSGEHVGHGIARDRMRVNSLLGHDWCLP
jgi:hypothetical protein